MTRVKLFVGCAPDGIDAESMAVLEYGARSRCSLPVDITWMHLSPDPESLFYWSPRKGLGWNLSAVATPFSPFRWLLPMACGFQGRAIYSDSDVIILGDLAQLWSTPLDPGQVVAARAANKFCISLWDCAAARPHMLQLAALRQAQGHERQARYFRTHPSLVRCFGPEWNYLDDQDEGPFTKIVHYTDLRTQPHFNYAIPRLSCEGREHWYDGPIYEGRQDVSLLFERELSAALTNGYNVERYIPLVEERLGEFKKKSMVGYKAR